MLLPPPIRLSPREAAELLGINHARMRRNHTCDLLPGGFGRCSGEHAKLGVADLFVLLVGHYCRRFRIPLDEAVRQVGGPLTRFLGPTVRSIPPAALVALMRGRTLEIRAGDHAHLLELDAIAEELATLIAAHELVTAASKESA